MLETLIEEVPRTAGSYALRGKLEGESLTLPLLPGTNHLGSSPTCDLRLRTSGVSRHHADFQVEDDRVSVQDLGSKNGTFVNRVRIDRAALRPGDRVVFGKASLVLERIHPDETRIAVDLGLPPGESALPVTETRHVSVAFDDVDMAEFPNPRSGDRPGPTSRGLVFPPGHVVGASPAMVDFYGRLHPVVRSDLPVLVLGETGTGKESVAQILHASSHRARHPLVILNCAAIPHDLMEAELFGIGDGVATGVAGRTGKFQEAHQGTLFLDEIADLPLSLQAKLLRALQDGQVQPVGGKPEAVDVRLVAATNGNLEKQMDRGLFRADLYYRLAGLVIRLPPLRRRLEDLPALVGHFLRCENEKAGKAVRGFTVGAVRRLAIRSWPGNIRELQHEVRRLAYSAGDGRFISTDLVTDSTSPWDDGPTPFDFRGVESLELDELEKSAIAEALRRSPGHLTEAAGRLGISRQALRRRMARHGL